MEYGNRIIQYPKEYSMCTGCMSCEIVCALVHDGVVSPSRSRIKVQLGETNKMVHTILSCQQCADHPCYDACPKKGTAMLLDETTGLVRVDPEGCIGCGLCAKKCKFTPSRIQMLKLEGQKYKRRALKCDLCYGREGGPACVQWCPVRALGLSENSTDDLSRPLEKEGV